MSPFGSPSGGSGLFGGQQVQKSQQDLIKEIQAFYQQHNPEKLTQLPSLLQKYAGKEAEMLEKLKNGMVQVAQGHRGSRDQVEEAEEYVDGRLQ